MITLPSRIATIEVKVEVGFQKLDQQIEAVEKQLHQKIDHVEKKIDLFSDRLPGQDGPSTSRHGRGRQRDASLPKRLV